MHTMFTVKCKSEQRIFNSNCHIINLLSCIYQTFEYEPSIVLDLADETTGSLQNLKEYPKEYANTILKPRGTYVLVQITKNEDGSLQYTPLWEGANQKPLTVKPTKLSSSKLSQSPSKNFPKKKPSTVAQIAPQQHLPQLQTSQQHTETKKESRVLFKDGDGTTSTTGGEPASRQRKNSKKSTESVV